MNTQNNDVANSGSRLCWIDIAKGLAITLVVYRHVFEGLARAGLGAKDYSWLENANILFFSFRMPLFFIIAGMFVEKSISSRGFRGFLNEKVSSILYPFVVWGLLQISLQLILSSYVNADRSLLSYLDLFLRPRKIDQFWYLFALFNTFLVFAICRLLFNGRSIFLLLTGFGFYGLSALLNKWQMDAGFLYDILHYFVFMALGHMLAAWAFSGGVAKLAAGAPKLVLLVLAFVSSQALFLQLNLEAADASYVEQQRPWLYLLVAVVGALSVMVFSHLLSLSRLRDLLAVIGKYSLQVYVMHVLLASATRMLFVKVFGVSSVPLLLLLGIGVAIFASIAVARLAERFNLDWIYSGKWMFGLEAKRGL